MRVVENDGRGVELLRKADAVLAILGFSNWENRSDLFSQLETALATEEEG